jgi:hypothetical protein
MSSRSRLGCSPSTLSIDSPQAGRPIMVPTVMRMPGYRVETGCLRGHGCKVIVL